MPRRKAGAPPRAGVGCTRLALPWLAVLALTAPPAGAADAGDPALRKEVKALEERMRLLEHRIDVLEGRSTPIAPAKPQAEAAPPPAPIVAAPMPAAGAGSPPAGYVSPEAALRLNWSRIRQGLEAGEVVKLLGQPSRKLTLDGRTVWYYLYPGTGRGSVFFNDAGHVSSAQSPFGLGW